MLFTHKPGDKITLFFAVKENDTAKFEAVEVHPVYATFALGRDAEWTTRQFVLSMKEPNEEGIGTFLHIQHQSPALLGQNVKITAIFDTIKGNEIICNFDVSVGERLIAFGSTGQKILKKEKLKSLFDSL